MNRNAPAESGVYGLSDSRRWLYVGETADIRAELIQHLKFPDAFLKEHVPSGFTFELSSAEQRIARQNRLVFEFEPIGNRLDRSKAAGRS